MGAVEILMSNWHRLIALDTSIQQHILEFCFGLGSKMKQESPYDETKEAQDEARQAQDGPGETQYESRGAPNDPMLR